MNLIEIFFITEVKLEKNKIILRICFLNKALEISVLTMPEQIYLLFVKIEGSEN